MAWLVRAEFNVTLLFLTKVQTIRPLSFRRKKKKTDDKKIKYMIHLLVAYLSLHHSDFRQPPTTRFLVICSGINLEQLHSND